MFWCAMIITLKTNISPLSTAIVLKSPSQISGASWSERRVGLGSAGGTHGSVALSGGLVALSGGLVALSGGLVGFSGRLVGFAGSLVGFAGCLVVLKGSVVVEVGSGSGSGSVVVVCDGVVVVIKGSVGAITGGPVNTCKYSAVISSSCPEKLSGVMFFFSTEEQLWQKARLSQSRYYSASG